MARCKGTDCPHEAVAHGWCHGHNKRRERGVPIDDTPLGPSRATGPRYTGDKRFWSKVMKTSDCWYWTASKDQDGYGVFTVNVEGTRKYRKAHRVSYEMEHGSSPVYDGNLQLRHLCGNASCVRPDHLVPGTAFENVKDALGHGTRDKLSDDDVDNLLTELDRGKITQRQIAEMFGISPAAVTRIKQGKLHREIFLRHYDLTDPTGSGTL